MIMIIYVVFVIFTQRVIGERISVKPQRGALTCVSHCAQAGPLKGGSCNESRGSRGSYM